MIKSHQIRNLAARPRAGLFSVLILLAGGLAVLGGDDNLGRGERREPLTSTNTSRTIPWNEIGAKAGADYKGDGLTVTATESGARLHCVFQRLDGEATPEGLWLTSTLTNTVSDRFRVIAMAVGRKADDATFNFPYPESSIPLSGAGEVTVSGQTARLSRPGLTEEYSVNMDGVRQDFIVAVPPGRGERCEPLISCPSPISPFPRTSSQPGGELVVKLAVIGAQIEAAADGARLVLANSGRKIAYSRLRVTDATGRELPARLEVQRSSAVSLQPSAFHLSVVVDDTEAVYPVRIDPTFSDANWVSLGGVPGAGGRVEAAVIDGSGNLCIGGQFTGAGNTIASNIAQWSGTSWSPLGSGVNGEVSALAVSGSTLYAGGHFTTAGGIAANDIAQWNGSSWSALGSGMDNKVAALAVSGSTVYAGGYFSTAGGGAATNIAQWNGSSWSALGSGMNSQVNALAVSGGTLYAGGYFTTAGGSAANNVAKWNGSSWSALGSGMRATYPLFLRWRCRAARCMRAAISRRRAAARPLTSRNGTGAVGRPSVRG